MTNLLKKLNLLTILFSFLNFVLPMKTETSNIKEYTSNNLDFYTISYGGNAGKFFSDDYDHIITKLKIRHNSSITQIQTFSNNVWNIPHGGNIGTLSTWKVPYGDCIIGIKIRYGMFVESLQFFTKRGSASPQFGSKLGKYDYITLPKCLKGIYGKASNKLNKIGFFY